MEENLGVHLRNNQAIWTGDVGSNYDIETNIFDSLIFTVFLTSTQYYRYYGFATCFWCNILLEILGIQRKG